MSNGTMLTTEEVEAAKAYDPTTPRTVTVELPLSETALQRVRSGFNPDMITDVGKMHVLGAAMITFLEGFYLPVPTKPADDAQPHERHMYLREFRLANEQNRHVSMAITAAEEATMFGVKAITTRTYASKNVKG